MLAQRSSSSAVRGYSSLSTMLLSKGVGHRRALVWLHPRRHEGRQFSQALPSRMRSLRTSRAATSGDAGWPGMRSRGLPLGVSSIGSGVSCTSESPMWRCSAIAGLGGMVTGGEPRAPGGRRRAAADRRGSVDVRPARRARWSTRASGSGPTYTISPGSIARQPGSSSIGSLGRSRTAPVPAVPSARARCQPRRRRRGGADRACRPPLARGPTAPGAMATVMLHTREVAGSKPAAPTSRKARYGGLSAFSGCLAVGVPGGLWTRYRNFGHARCCRALMVDLRSAGLALPP
jgi:hypothetical protein